MKRILSLLVALALVVTCTPVMPSQARAETVGYYTYEVSNGEATITECNTSISGAVTIPATLGGYPVTAIGPWAFYECTELVAITIPDSLTSVGEGAFTGCCALTGIFANDGNACYSNDAYGVLYNKDLTTLVVAPGALSGSYTIPDGVTYIDNDAFASCGALEYLSVPDSLAGTGYEVFFECTSLHYNTYENAAYLGNSTNPYVMLISVDSKDITACTIHEDTKVIYDAALEDCVNLTSITIPDQVVSIGQNVFAGCDGLTTVTIPDSVESIGHCAFFGCANLVSITLPSSVTSIGEGVFYNCRSFTTVYYQGTEAQKENIEIGIENDILLNANWICSGTAIGGAVGENLTWTLEDGTLTVSGTGAMEDFDWVSMPWSDYKESITGVVIGEGVTSIGARAFVDCINMNNLTLPDGLISIGEYAFAYCTSLPVVLLPESVTDIGSYAFGYGSSLTGIYVDENNDNYCSDDKGVLFNKDKTVLIAAPGGISGSYTVPTGVTEIYNEAFYDCNHLTDVVIPEGVTQIGAYTFAYSESLTQLTIPGSVTNIGTGAFMDSTGLTAIWVDENNAYYSSDDSGVLFNKDKTTLITAPAGISGSYQIPDGVTSIETEAFCGCHNLIEVTIPEGVTTIGWYAFENCHSLESIIIPDSVTNLYGCTFLYCSSLSSVKLSENITEIGECTFDHCSSLTDIIIPEGVTTIGVSAFYWCESLKSITIPDTVTSIEDSALFFCNALTDVYYGGTEEQWYAIDIGANNEALTRATIYIEATDTIIPGTGPVVPEPDPDPSEPVTDVVSGTCGENLTWTLENGILNIFGTGAMEDFSEGTSPWNEYTDDIVYVVVHPGVTTIGHFAFSGCTSLEMAAISEGVETVGVFAFSGCTNLTKVMLPVSVHTVFYAAFSNCIRLTEVYYAGTVNQWSEIILADENKFLNREILYTNRVFVDPAQYPESDHDYAESLDVSQTVSFPGAIALELTFSQSTETEQYYDCIYLYDSNGNQIAEYSGTEAAGQTVTIPDGSVTVRLTTDGSVQNYGYSFVAIVARLFEEVEGTCGNALAWKLDGTGTLTISGTGAMFDYNGGNMPWQSYSKMIKHVVVEDGVTTIGDYAFYYYNNSLTSVTIADSVTDIGVYAFSDCNNLTEATLGKGIITIGDYAFAWTGLTSVSIPESVLGIGSDVFDSCNNLTGIWVDENNANYSSDSYGVLFNKDRTTLIKAPCSLSGAYEIPDSVIEILTDAFTNCESLTGVNIPENVITIGWGAFENCSSLTGIWVDENNANYSSDSYGVLFDKDRTTLIKAPGSLSGFYEIPSGVTYITSEAFKYCKSLTGVKIPEGVTEINPFMFTGCENLLSVSIPDSVTYISEYAFSDCVKLTDIAIPDGVTYIGSHAFAWCYELTEVTLPDGITTVSSGLFTQCYGLTSVTVPASVTYVEYGAFMECENLTDVYYKGIEEEIANIQIEGDNNFFTAATWHCTGIVECEYLEAGSEEAVQYKSLEDALEVATSGTITLLADASAATAILRPGVTLDLNGYTLTADLVVGMKNSVILDGGDACNGGGLLQVEQDNFIYARDTQQQIIPVWNGVDGYLFTKVTFQQLARTGGEGAAQYIFLPTLSNKEASALLADGGVDNALSFKVSLTWSDGQCQQFYTYNDGFVAQVFASNGGLAFSLTVTGISGIADMVASAVVVTESGAQATVTGTTLIPG